MSQDPRKMPAPLAKNERFALAARLRDAADAANEAADRIDPEHAGKINEDSPMRVANAITKLQEAITAANTLANNAKTRVTELENSVAALNDKVNNLTGRAMDDADIAKLDEVDPPEIVVQPVIIQ